MASIASAVIVGTNIVPASKVKMVTFGQPRTGDLDFAIGYDALVRKQRLGATKKNGTTFSVPV